MVWGYLFGAWWVISIRWWIRPKEGVSFLTQMRDFSLFLEEMELLDLPIIGR
jgi:hypothetical protein